MPDIDLPEPSALRSRPPYHRPFVSRFTQAFGLLTGTVRLLQSERDFERTVSFSAARASLQPTINALPNPLKEALSNALDQEYLAHYQSSTTGVTDIAGNLAIGISSIVGTSIPFAGAAIGGQLVANGSLVCFKKSRLLNAQNQMPPVKTILTAPMFTSLAQFFTEFESEKRIHRTSKLTKSVVDIVAGSISVGLSSSGALAIFSPIPMAIDGAVQLETSIYDHVVDHYRSTSAVSIHVSETTPFSIEIRRMNAERIKHKAQLNSTSRWAAVTNGLKMVIFATYLVLTAAPKLVAVATFLLARLVGEQRIAKKISNGIERMDSQVKQHLRMLPSEPDRLYLEQEALLRLLDAWQQAGNDDQLKHQLVTFFESRFPAFRNPMGRDWTQSPVVQLLNRPDLAQDLKLRLGSYRVGLREL